jgi:phage shock protein PspC (stress-responsive transcriptional regulator)
MNKTNILYRSTTDVIFGGVAGGLADYIGTDSALIRIIFIFLTLAGGSGVLLYFIMWLIVPKQSKIDQEALTKETLEENAREIESKAKEAVESIKKGSSKSTQENQDKNYVPEQRRNWLGIGLVVIGALLLMQNLQIINRGMFWPLALMLVGLMILLR